MPENTPEASIHVLSTVGLDSDGRNLTFLATRGLRFEKMTAFSAAKLPSCASWLSIFRRKIVVNWSWQRFFAKKSPSTGVEIQFGGKNRSQLRWNVRLAVEIAVNWGTEWHPVRGISAIVRWRGLASHPASGRETLAASRVDDLAPGQLTVLAPLTFAEFVELQLVNRQVLQVATRETPETHETSGGTGLASTSF